MKIWEEFKACLKRKFYGGNIFVCKGTLPKTDNEIYWYNRALQDCVMDMKNYESMCENKYKSLLDSLTKKGIYVTYDKLTNKHMIHVINTNIEL